MNHLGYPAGHGVGPRPGGQRGMYDPTLYHVLVVGQSNGTGADAVLPAGYAAGSPALSVTPYGRGGAGLPDAWMLSPGVRASGQANAAATGTLVRDGAYPYLLPLAESADSTPHGETVAWGLAYRLRQQGLSVLVSSSSADGFRINQVNKGTTYFSNTLEYVKAGQFLARRAGRPSRVLAMILLAGEADQSFAVTGFSTTIATLRSDYELAIRAITGQGEEIPLYFSQMVSGAPNASGVFAAGTSTSLQMWLANKADPWKLVLTGARYHLGSRMSDGSNIHLNPWAMRRHGEEFGLAIARHQFGPSRPWRPVMPIPGRVNFDGVPGSAPSTTIVADFYGSFPLTLDYSWVGRVNSPLLGFTYFDDTSPPTVTAVSQTGPYQLTFTLSGTPTGGAGTYALRGGFGTSSTTGSLLSGDVRINLRDTAPDVAYDGTPLHSFCGIFHEAVT